MNFQYLFGIELTRICRLFSINGAVSFGKERGTDNGRIYAVQLFLWRVML